MSVYELADRSGIARNTIYNWYSKNYCPTLDTLQIVCEKGFDMSLAEFFAMDSELIVATPETKEMFQMYSTLTDVQKQAVKQMILSYKNK